MTPAADPSARLLEFLKKWQDANRLQSYEERSQFRRAAREFIVELEAVRDAARDQPLPDQCPQCQGSGMVMVNHTEGEMCPNDWHERKMEADAARSTGLTDPDDRVWEIAQLLRDIFNGFKGESLNGVVCSIPDEGLDAANHRLWCKRCQRRWKEFDRLVRELNEEGERLRVLGPAHRSEPIAEARDDRSGPIYPIPLNDEQERVIKEWAADDRLWTTQETVEFNLRPFARKILAAVGPARAEEQTK